MKPKEINPMGNTYKAGDQVGIRTIPGAVGTILQTITDTGGYDAYTIAYTTDQGITEKVGVYTPDQFTGVPQTLVPVFADGRAEALDRLATDTARYIASVLVPAQRTTLDLPGVTVNYIDDRRPPATVEGIKLALLEGRIWILWMDDRVTAAMRQLHGEPTGDAALL